MTKSILVTGATGFIGSRLVNSLIDKGYNVTSLIRKGKEGNVKSNIIYGDITDENIDFCEGYLERFIGRWFTWLDEAEEVPESERNDQQIYDFQVRELGYRNDPMNVLPIQMVRLVLLEKGPMKISLFAQIF